jgi:putative spermidine/putrescine transport system permease protein
MRTGRPAAALAACGYAFLLAPLLVVCVLSFTSGQYLPSPPPGFLLRWYGGLALGHLVVVLPFVARLMAGAFANLPPQLEEAAAMLGARPLRAFRLITWPLAAPGAIAAAVLAVDRLVGFTRILGRS